jgi:hypothetical protein
MVVSTGDRQMRQWDYTWVSDVGQYMWFMVDTPPDIECSFTVKYELWFSGWGGDPVYFGPILFEPGPNNQSLNLSQESYQNPKFMTDSQRQSKCIEKISRGQLEERAIELNIPAETTKELLNTGEQYFYFTNNYPMKITVP